MSEKRTFIPPEFRPRVKGEQIEAPSSMQMSSGKKTLSLESTKQKKAILCINVREDKSQAMVLEKYAKKNSVVFLNYDDIGITWNFSYIKGQLVFYTAEGQIIPLGIYCRPYCPIPTHPQYHLCHNFSHVMQCWKGRKITAGMNHYHNSSKAFQMDTTIRNAIKKTGSKRFHFPHSYFVKGTKHFEKLLKQKQALIVKSSSGIRSEVTTEEHFKKWNKKGINHVPTLFQHACFGLDIRVHYLKGHCWQIILHEKKGGIDYRYAKEKGSFACMEWDEDVKKFCQHMYEFEKLYMAGVDFIKVGKDYYCLECNPNPGWAGFHRACGQEPEVAHTILKDLKG